MAKKKVQPTPEKKEIFKVDFTEDIETGVAEGTKDAKEFYTLTSINRSLNSKQVTKELNDQHTKAREKLEFYRDKVERKLLLKYTMDFYYWSSYLLTLNQNGVNGEVVKNDAPQRTFEDLFIDAPTFKKAISAIKKVILDKHENFIRGKHNNIATTYWVLTNKKYLNPDVSQTKFSSMIASHFKSTFSTGKGVNKGAYTEEIAIKLESELTHL